MWWFIHEFPQKIASPFQHARQSVALTDSPKNTGVEKKAASMLYNLCRTIHIALPLQTKIHCIYKRGHTAFSKQKETIKTDSNSKLQSRY